MFTRACFSEQMIANCRSGAAGEEDALASTEDVGDIPALRLVDDDWPVR